MLPVRTSAQLEVLLLVIRYSKEAKLVAMLSSFFAGVDDWIKVGFTVVFMKQASRRPWSYHARASRKIEFRRLEERADEQHHNFFFYRN